MILIIIILERKMSKLDGNILVKEMIKNKKKMKKKRKMKMKMKKKMKMKMKVKMSEHE